MMSWSRSRIASILLLVLLVAVSCAEQRTWEEIRDAAVAAQQEGRMIDAEEEFDALLSVARGLGEQDQRLVISLNLLGGFEMILGREDRALEHFREAIELREAQLGEDDPELARSYTGLATHYQALNRLDEARSCLERALAINEKTTGPDHPVVAESLNNLALVAYFQEDYVAAHAWAERAVRLLDALQPPASGPGFAATLTNMAQIESARGELEQAEALFQRAETTLSLHFGANSVPVARARNNRAEVLGLLERYTEAEVLYLESLAVYDQFRAPDDPELTVSLNNLGRLYRQQERYEEAEHAYRRSIEILEKLPVQAHPDLAASLFNLARVYVLQSSPDKADPLFQRAITLYEGTLGPSHANVVAVRNSYADFLRDNGRADEAERLQAAPAAN